MNPFQLQLKNDLMSYARDFDIETLKKNENKNDTVTLYHGTSTFHLNSILENGILPRNLTGNNNWKNEVALSNENIVYLTNKWHYFYAYNATEMLLEGKYGEEWSSIPEAQWWLTKNPLPVYIECKIPKVYLTVDEDIVFTKYVKDKLKSAVKSQKDLELKLTWEDSLAHQGTVGVRGGIPKEWITSFTVLGDGHLYMDLMGDKTTYKKEYMKWMDGKGKGKLKKEDLKRLEDKHKFVGTIPVHALRKGYKVSQFYYDPEQKSVGLVMNTPEEYVQQPRQLEII